MGVKIIYSNLSKNDLKEIYNFIARDSVFYARREVSLIRDAINELKHNVFIGRRFAKFDNDLIRELIFKNYLIIHEISADHKQISVLSIHHHSRLLANNLAFGDKE